MEPENSDNRAEVSPDSAPAARPALDKAAAGPGAAGRLRMFPGEALPIPEDSQSEAAKSLAAEQAGGEEQGPATCQSRPSLASEVMLVEAQSTFQSSMDQGAGNFANLAASLVARAVNIFNMEQVKAPELVLAPFDTSLEAAQAAAPDPAGPAEQLHQEQEIPDSGVEHLPSELSSRDATPTQRMSSLSVCPAAGHHWPPDPPVRRTVSKAEIVAAKRIARATAEAEAVVEDFKSLLRCRYGSVLRGWRAGVDPECYGDLLFMEFVEALARVDWHGDSSALWTSLAKRSAGGDETTLSLRELSPEDAALIQRCRHWAKEEFGSIVGAFQAMTNHEPNASLTLQDFQRVSAAHGFSEEEATAVFTRALDLDADGGISLADMAFLEESLMTRLQARDPFFVMSLEAAKAVARRKKRRQRHHRHKEQDAMREFQQKLRAASGGSFVRGWRRILDLDGNLAVSKVELLQGCRKIAFAGDVAALWKAMDITDDGTVHLQEVDRRMALILAGFKTWAVDLQGSCTGLMQHLALLSRHRWQKWTSEQFTDALILAGFPSLGGLPPRAAAAMVHEAFDQYDVGKITIQDVAFLDKWEPAAWLVAHPDEEAKERFIGALRGRYGYLIVAWRRLLDRDHCNRVSYKELSDACKLFRLDNPAGIWRAIDVEANGFISLHDMDPQAAGALETFRDWAEETFGTIQFAFRAMDTHNTGALSLPLLRRALRDFGYPGNAKILFQTLKPDTTLRQTGRDARITVEDLRYLGQWRSFHRGVEESDDNISDPELSPHRSVKESGSESGRHSIHSAASKMPRPQADDLHFCKSAKEYCGFMAVQRDARPGRAPRPSPPPPPSGSPYDAPVVSPVISSYLRRGKPASVGRLPSAAQVSTKASASPAKSSSLPTLPSLPSSVVQRRPARPSRSVSMAPVIESPAEMLAEGPFPNQARRATVALPNV